MQLLLESQARGGRGGCIAPHHRTSLLPAQRALPGGPAVPQLRLRTPLHPAHPSCGPSLRSARPAVCCSAESRSDAPSTSSHGSGSSASASEASSAPTRWQLASSALADKPVSALTRLLGGSVLLGGFLGTGWDISGPGSVLEALGVLAAIVAVHECGHFLAARTQNIHVSKFALGFGPPLIKYQGNEVEYSLRAIPLGGFVAFPDEDPDCPYPPDDPDLLKNRPIGDRALVISAGVIANVIFAFAVLFAQASTVGVAQSDFRAGVRVPEVVVGSVAERAGVKPGDLILKVGDKEVPAAPRAVSLVVNTIRASANQELTLTVERQGETVLLPVTPAEAPDGDGRIGVQLTSNATITKVVAQNPVEAAQFAARDFSRLLGSVTGGLQQIVTNFSATAEQVSGPVAIVAVGAEAARSDVTGLFQFAAILNINLAVVNILPLPALDGGYLLLLAIELVRGGKKLPSRVEQGVMASGLLLLTGLGFALIIHDALNLSFVKALLQ